MSLTALGLLKFGPVPGVAPKNPAIARCCEAWERRYEAEISKDDDYVLAAHYADSSYRDAMPPLTDYENIRDFIACATHGMLIEAILYQHGTQLLYAAQVALSTLRYQPQQTGAPGRPKCLPDK